MSDMKSAYERAMERAEKIGKATPEELQRMQALPLGNQLAARFMKEPNFDIAAEISRYKGSPVRKQIIEGALEILLRYITLPSGPVAREVVNRAKQGILALKDNKRMVESIFGQIDNLLNYYEQARQQAVTQLKQAFDQQTGQMRGMGGQGQQGARATDAAQMQFRDEVARVLGDLNRQYEQALDEQKRKILQAA